MAYIYIIENDINDKKYIGKTTFSIEKRWAEHCRDCKREHLEKRPLYRAMNKYGIQHFKIRELEFCSNAESSEREKFWINFYNSYGSSGYNATLGGDGKNFLDYEKILFLCDTTKLTQKEIARECNCNKDSVKNIVHAYRPDIDWQKRALKYPNSLGLVPLKVQCVETQEIFESAGSASKWVISQGKVKSRISGHILEVCRGKRETAGGYHWRIADKDENE